MSVATFARVGINRALRPLGVRMVRDRSIDPAIRPTLSAKETITAARQAGLSVCDFVDAYGAEPRSSSAVVQAMLQIGALGNHVDRVCEIGPESGRYAEKVIAALGPSAYEIYAATPDWLPYLRRLPNLVERPTDGHTLAATASASVDLVHAHRVFVHTPFVTTVGYLEEMARVVRWRGVVAFEVVTESCLEGAPGTWVSQHADICSVAPRAWIVDLMERRGLTLAGTHFVPFGDALTELLVFREL